jgi:hypothetical protein
MMQAFLSSLTYHPYGFLALELESTSELTSRGRRVARTETLDGGVVFEDMGYTHGDRTLRVVALVNRPTYERLCFLLETFQFLSFSCAEGLFTVAPQSLVVEADTVRLTLLVKSKEG